MEWWQVYLWTRVEALYVVCNILAIGSTISFIVLKVFQIVNEDMEDIRSANILGKNAKKCLFIMLVFCPIAMVVPSQSDFAMIYVLPKIANSSVIQQDVPEVYNLAIDQLKKTLGNK